MSFLAYILGFLAACSNAGANTLQRAANREEENQDEEFSLQLIRNLLHQPLWFAGMACMAGSFFLQAAGLGFGTLSGVEPLLVLELPLTMVASFLWLHEGIDRRAWIAVASMTASTIALIAFLGPGNGKTTGIPWWVWFVAIALTAALVGGCYVLGVRWKDENKRSMILGIGTGACYGLAASLVKGMTEHFSSGGIVGVFEAWQLYAAVVVGALAVWMHQNAVSAAKLVVAQPGVTLGDPYIAIIWGATVFGEPMRGGFWILLAVLAGLALTASSVVLSRSQSTDEDQAAGGTPDSADDKTDRDGRHPSQPAVSHGSDRHSWWAGERMLRR
jgi:drug/metabolite transporter (DMT)-like permease